tara:strand:+ start:1126 stop:1668 length:543 start_codon:yes stop_codon:yes gene_type:complete
MLDKEKRVARRAANKAGRASAEGKTKLGKRLNWKKTKAGARKAARKGGTPKVETKAKVSTPKSKVMVKDAGVAKKAPAKQTSASPGGKPGATKRKTGMTYRTSWDANKSGVQAKYKDKGGYEAYKKDASDWNKKNDAKKSKPKKKVVPLKLNKTDPLKGKGAGSSTISKGYKNGGYIQHS